ncbi:MAG: TIGR02597 family protein [Luteolibacter sp.]
MKTLIPLTAIAALAASGLSSAQTTAYSKPSGYITLGNADGSAATPDVPANTDVTVSVPFERASEVSGKITGRSGSVLSFANAGLTNNSLVSSTTPYQITITSGAQAGLIGVISANTSTSVTVGSVIVGDINGIETNGTASFSISKAWTLGTFFPTNLPAGTNVLAFSGTVAGPNLAPNEGYVYSGSAWFQTLGTGGNGSHTMIFPGESMILRSSVAIDSLVVTGSVPTVVSKTVVSKLSASQAQDTRIAFNVSTDQPIENLTGVQAGDSLLAFNNAAAGKNKSPNEILVYSGSAWFGTTGVTGPQNGLYKLKAGQGYILRRPSTAPVGNTTISLVPNYAGSL